MGRLGCGYTAAEERSDPTAIGAGSNRSGSPYCPDPQQRPHGLAGGHRVQPAQPDRNADRPLEGCHRPQAQIPQLLQADHGNQGRPESSEHNDRTRTACVRTHSLTLPLGRGRIPSPPRSMQQHCWSFGPDLRGAILVRGYIRLVFLTIRVVFALIPHKRAQLSYLICHDYKGQFCTDRRRSRAGRVEDFGHLDGRRRVRGALRRNARGSKRSLRNVGRLVHGQ